jgi:hypothetical protein
MAGEASSLKAKVVMPGSKDRPGFRKQLTLKTVIEWIRMQGLDEYTEEGLIESASKYPTQALPSFRKNFNLMIQRVRQQRKKELGQVEEEVKEIQDAESESEVRNDPIEQPVDGETTGDNDGSTIVYA